MKSYGQTMTIESCTRGYFSNNCNEHSTYNLNIFGKKLPLWHFYGLFSFRQNFEPTLAIFHANDEILLVTQSLYVCLFNR